MHAVTSPNGFPRVGAYVYWNGSLHVGSVWQIESVEDDGKLRIIRVAGARLRFVGRREAAVAVQGNIREIPPIVLIALMARTQEEWDRDYYSYNPTKILP